MNNISAHKQQTAGAANEPSNKNNGTQNATNFENNQQMSSFAISGVENQLQSMESQ